MSLRHVALLRFLPDTTSEHVTALMSGLATLPPAIPELREYRFGPDVGLADDNWHFAIVADFDDAAAYERYQVDPEHRALIEKLIVPILEARAAVQHEV